MISTYLHRQLELVAPIASVSIGKKADKSTWKVVFKDNATAQQRTQAQQIINSFDVAAFEQKIKNIEIRQNEAETEAILATELKNLTPQQAVDYIETNVTNLATAKTVLKIMARLLIAMRDKVMPDLPDL